MTDQPDIEDNMQDREKKLAIALGAVILFAVVLPMFERWFIQPVTEARNRLESTQEKLAGLEADEALLKRARRNLEDWDYESLPPNPTTAQRKYQQWLMDLARMSHFTDLVPTLPNLPTVVRSGSTYVEIPVIIEARADFEQLSRFLYHFERAALLHQIQSLDVKSPAASGNPLLEVTIRAHGLSLVDAPARSQLFPTVTLLEEISAAGDQVKVDSLEGFPLVDGFQIKIDQELMTVRKRSENALTIERGAENTVATAHSEGSAVELFPVDRQRFASGHSFEEYRDLLENSPFVKPTPPVDYDPKLSPRSPQTITRGEPWKLQLELSGWDPAGGDAAYTLQGDVPLGMTIDAETGDLHWDPDKDVPVGDYEVQVLARSDIMSDQRASLTLPVTLREPNLPPTIEAVDTLTVFSGRPLEIAVQADDPDGDNSGLEYSLTGEVPDGATIDGAGALTWTPPLTLELGEYTLSIQVADSGDPQKTTTHDVKVTLEDDAALFTQLSGSFIIGEKPEAMLRNLTSGKTSRLSEGDKVTAAEIHGTIVGIEPSHIVLQVGEEKYRLDLGHNLRQMTLIEAGETAADEGEAPSES